jgi:hypothetical protein
MAKNKIKDKEAFNVGAFVRNCTKGPKKREKTYGLDTQIKFPWYDSNNDKRVPKH